MDSNNVIFGSCVCDKDDIFLFDTSVTELIIELGDKSIVYAKAYDEVADYIYRKIER